MSTRTLLIGGIAVIFILAIAAIAVSTGDNNTGVVVNKDTTQPKDTTPPPPPPPVEPQSPPPPVVAAVDTGLMELVRLPRGAEVYVDGVRRQGRPIRLPIGKHVIEGKAPGYRDAREEVMVVAGPMRVGLKWQQLPPDTTPKVVVRTPDPPPKSPCVVATEANNWATIRQACLTDARAGNAAAMRSLAVAYLRGGAADEGEAVTWLQKSADGGNRESQYDLGRVYQRSSARRNERRAVEMFILAGNAGHADAAFQLGRMYEKGQGTSKNESEALRWFTKAAEQGHADAQGGVGVFYLKGIGTRRDDTKALDWLRKGAAAGSAAAMYNLGTMYEEGRAGLPKSRSTAREWYRKAANLGDPEAKKALGQD
jgi:TPR repeat protein